MENRSSWLEAELFTVKAENFELKTMLKAGISNAKAKNIELKTRLMQGKKQWIIFDNFPNTFTIG